VRLYLDTCFLNRPFDEQAVDRIRLETEALKIVLRKIERDHWSLVSSEILELEIHRIPDRTRREPLYELLTRTAVQRLKVNDPIIEHAALLQSNGILGFAHCISR